jgi:hypothetical protein
MWPIIYVSCFVRKRELLAIQSSDLNAVQKLPRHMYKETFLPIGVAIVTLQKKFWPHQIRIVMPYWFRITISHKTNAICHVWAAFVLLRFCGLWA